MRNYFKPEFLNRLDDIVLFRSLSEEDIIKIVDLRVRELSQRLENNGITLELSKKAKEFIAKNGYDEIYGARPLNRFIQNNIENKIARMIIEGLEESTKIYIDLNSEGLSYKSLKI